MQHPDRSEIQAVYNDIFYTGPYLTLAKLREAGFQARLLRVRPNDPEHDELVPGRSIAWKLFLISSSGDSTNERPNPKNILMRLREKRVEYTEAYGHEMIAPDGSWIEGYSPTDQRPKTISRELSEQRGLEANNPLSLDQDNPWKTYFASLDVLKSVQQDVERTFPDIPFFRLPYVQKELIIILFVYAQRNRAVGYRQGMHEIAACLYMALAFDSLEQSEDKKFEEVEEFCSCRHVAADASHLLSILLSPNSHLGKWFEWREPSSSSPVVSGPTVPFIVPIVQTCNYLQNVLLKSIDPPLYNALKDNGIEPTIYGIRWLRLLFTREFEIQESMLLWDTMFAADSSLEIAVWIGLAMLVRIRNNLIPSSYNAQLSSLLRYPSLVFLGDLQETNHIILLVRQAAYLRESPTVASGATIVYENRNVLGIESNVPARQPAHLARQSTGNTKQPVINVQGLPDFAKGILDRGEQWGVNRTVLNTISGIRRNLPDIAQSLQGRGPISSGPLSEFSTVSLNPPSESRSETRPPWEPKTRFEIEREVTAIRGTLKTLSEAVGMALDVLLQTDSGQEQQVDDQSRRREALECLDYVREVLGQGSRGDQTPLDEGRLWGEHELQRRRAADASHRRANLEQEDRKGTQETSASAKIVEISPPTKPVSMGRTSRGASLPVNTPPEKLTSSRSTGQVVAPWNHTPSSFSSTSSTYTLPRPPPSSLAPPPPARRSSRPGSGEGFVQQDPLGALR